MKRSEFSGQVDSSSEGSPSGLVSASSIESAKILADKATQVVPLTEHEGAEKPPQIKAVSEDAPSVATTELKLAAEPSSETQRARDDARDDAAGYGAAGASTTASTDLTNVLGAATGFEADGPSHATISNLEVIVYISMHTKGVQGPCSVVIAIGGYATLSI